MISKKKKKIAPNFTPYEINCIASFFLPPFPPFPLPSSFYNSQHSFHGGKIRSSNIRVFSGGGEGEGETSEKGRREVEGEGGREAAGRKGNEE